MWTQIVGKLCLALTPRSNHFWNVAFQVNACGLATPVMSYNGRSISMQFDFIDHKLNIICADGTLRSIALEPKSVKAFYGELMQTLEQMGINEHIWKMPVEIPNPIPFDKDETHHSYDRDKVVAFHQALLSIKPVLESFRCEFVGKCSPVHFFWGSFDLAVTRFSGRRAPAKPEYGAMYAEAYSHEVISHGFWPGGPWPTGGSIDEPVFYAYAVPAPDGLAESKVEPAAAKYDKNFGEFFLPYESVRTAASPEEELAKFLSSTYDSAATLAKWDRDELERH